MFEEAPQIFDRPLYLRRQASASGTEILHELIAEDLVERLSLILRRLPNALIIGPISNHISASLKATEKFDHIKFMVPSADMNLNLPPLEYDCIISLLDVQCINDVPGHFAQLGRSLKADGLLVVAFFAGDTLHELRQSWLDAEVELTGGASPRVAPMIGVRELGGLMQRANLALPVADIEKTTLRYADVFALMREIKHFGFSNPLLGRKQNFVSKNFLTKVAENYHAHNSDDDGRVRATLEIAWALAWKPHESQPQPLKQGSAKTLLADALKDLKTGHD